MVAFHVVGVTVAMWAGRNISAHPPTTSLVEDVGLMLGSGWFALVGAVAALQPLRRRVQRLVDRRFNRAGYDARQTAEALASRLRDETDLDALTSEVAQAVVGTIGPGTLSLRLRPTSADVTD